jgi:hypothetical protein
MMSVNRSRLVKTPASTMASYWSTVNRASRFWIHFDGGCVGVIVDMVTYSRRLSHLIRAQHDRSTNACRYHHSV